MFENLSLETLQIIWWMIVSLLGSIIVFLMFVQGGQTLIFQIAKTDDERTMLINSIGRKWDLTFTTLVTFGGAFFASFPLFYATSFGGAYWVWVVILFSFIIQAVSYEYRKKANNFLGQKTFEIFLFINGILAPLCIGTAVGTFFTGSAFQINDMNLSEWKNSARGLEALLDYRNVTLGISVYFLTRILGAQYFINSINDEQIYKRSKIIIKKNTYYFTIFFISFLSFLIKMDGYAVNPATHEITKESTKYLQNLIQMPVVGFAFVTGALLVYAGIFLNLLKDNIRGIWHTAIGTIMVVFCLFMIAGLNHTAFYPSNYDLQSSLTIYNSSSSHFTLTTMSYVALAVPFVIAYIWYAWKSMNKKLIDHDEMNENDHVY